ncbi:MAG: rhomboid family intramembrane serine protease [Nanoarchaeota archaeon]|nr:rhomboid family intramembrane serine protease [Nanoarchaeota archaeon]MBU1051282.1 rhomboid family intramembrane serine protease [Nanoarchaeota archaeon]
MPSRKFHFRALKLSGIIILVFLAQAIFSNFTSLFVLNELSWQQPWRFVTSIFLHGGLAHLVLNLFALLLFGSILEKFIGGKRLLLVFFITGILANLVSINFYNSSLGASGAIFGIIGCLVLIRPLMTIWAFGMPMPLFVAGVLWIIADLLGTYGFLIGNPIDNTGNIAHLSGMIFGILFGIIYRKLLVRRKKINASIDEHQVRNWERTWMKN